MLPKKRKAKAVVSASKKVIADLTETATVAVKASAPSPSEGALGASSTTLVNATSDQEATNGAIAGGQQGTASASDEISGANGPQSEGMGEAWRDYKRGDKDDEGGVIEEIFVRSATHVIYQMDGFVNFQADQEIIDRSNEIADLLNTVSILSPKNRYAREALNQRIARAIDLCLVGRIDASKLLLEAIIEHLREATMAGQRLFYFLSSTASAVVVWITYLILHSGGTKSGDWMPAGWEPWFLAASLGAVGGLLSVCMRLGTISIYLSQAWYVTLWAGLTRILIALLGGCACLLAIRSQVIMGIAAGDEVSSAVPLVLPEMFFCFLAGFSETFVANIFRQGENDVFQKPKDPVNASVK
jgi:hypothetical protein